MEIQSLVWLVVDLAVAGVLLYIAWIIINAIPMLAPFRQVVMAILTLIAILILVSMVMPLFGGIGHVGFHSRC